MTVDLAFADSAASIRASLRSFNRSAVQHPETLRSLVAATRYWIYDPEDQTFGPSKFVGLQNMTLEKYGLARQGKSLGATFDGHLTREAIEKALQRAFAPSDLLKDNLRSWLAGLLGDATESILSRIDHRKWLFITLPIERLSRPSHFVASWKYSTYERLSKDAPVENAGSNHYDRVTPGDTVWVVTVHDRRLFLVCRFVVDRVLRRDEAKRLWPDAWDAEFHIAAASGAGERLRHIDLTDIAAQIRFDGTPEHLPQNFQQSFRQLRRLTDDTAGLFRSIWMADENGGELGSERRRLEIDSDFDPYDDEDARTRTLSAIVRRQGQQDFRKALIAAYGGKCALTGCDAEAALEAAHIRPYLGPQTNLVRNGILLRADIHTLFDLHLLTIDPVTWTVVLSPTLRNTQYATLDGAAVRRPQCRSAVPSEEALRMHRVECEFVRSAHI